MLAAALAKPVGHFVKMGGIARQREGQALRRQPHHFAGAHGAGGHGLGDVAIKALERGQQGVDRLAILLDLIQFIAPARQLRSADSVARNSSARPQQDRFPFLRSILSLTQHAHDDRKTCEHAQFVNHENAELRTPKKSDGRENFNQILGRNSCEQKDQPHHGGHAMVDALLTKIGLRTSAGCRGRDAAREIFWGDVKVITPSFAAGIGQVRKACDAAGPCCCR